MFHPGKTVKDTLNRMSTSQPRAMRIQDFTELEKKCGQDHAVRTGISRAAVLVAGFAADAGACHTSW